MLYEIEMGDCLVHDSRLLHAGKKITKGKRFILVGFVDICSTIS